MKKSDHIQSAMRHHKIIFVVFAALVAFGIYSLPNLNKDEFPQFTIRQGVVAAIYPGATAQEVEEQVTKPLEQFLFTYKEIDKELTYSVSENGIVYVFVELRAEIENNDEVWSKIRHGLKLFKTTSMPAGVLEIVVVDDFGNTSSMLLAIESEQRSPRELENFSDLLCDKLRTIPEMGNLKVLGQQHEEISVNIDSEKISAYGIDQKILLAQLATQGFRTIGGTVEDKSGEMLVHLAMPYDSEYAIGEQIIYTNPSGHSIRLRDVASIERKYAEPSSYIEFDGKSTIIVSMEMCPGNNIVAFGEKVEKILEETSQILPPDVNLHRITDQPKVVDKSVISFLRDLVESMLVVIAVMLLLFPLRTALVAGSGVPVCTAITIGLMYLCGIELNTVTLAALIVVLGMIVDNSIIVIDGYTDFLQRGHSRWYSAAISTSQLFIPTLLATIAICGMFFPMTKIIKGPLGDFVQLFPWTILFALIVSLLYAVWVIPYLSTRFVKKNTDKNINAFERVQNKFFVMLQDLYDKTLLHCFRHPKMVIFAALGTLALGVFLFTRLNVQMLPKAERDCFAVEIHLTEGSNLKQTAEIVDSVQAILSADKRVKSVTSFVGCASPRFHATYAPQMAKKSYAQFIVNTISEKASLELLKEYGEKYSNAFPNAYIRFKQMDYQAVKNPVEINFSGDNLPQMQVLADSLKLFMNAMPELSWVHSNYDESTPNVKIKLKPDEASQLGITQSMLSVYLSTALGGQTLTSVWENDYKIPVVLYAQVSDTNEIRALENRLVPTIIPGMWVPLRQIADVEPEWQKASVLRRNSVRTITVGADLLSGSQPVSMEKIDKYIKETIEPIKPEGVTITYGGLTSANKSVIPGIVLSILAAILVLFVFLLYHFAKIDIAVLSIVSSLLCIFGACVGLWMFGLDFSITAVLGVVSLIGVIVRNAIIMFEYAESLRHEAHKSARDAAFEAGKRRMRPIFLTSATTALGVIPMIIAHTSLWMPMGVVICFGTIFTLPLVITVLPVAYWQLYK